MELDIRIAGAEIIDGTGAPRFTGDIGIAGGRIVEVGKVTSPARRTIDADGALVTPGFIDMHTHYDAQVLWDSDLVASTRNGVTTAVMGNCGVGCAPFTPDIKDGVKRLLEGVEDIAQDTLEMALDWDWTSFGSYLDRVADRPHAINLAANATHAPIRMIAMGARAFDGSQPGSDDIAMMKAMLAEALAAGACAFSTDRVELHTMAGGGQAPDCLAPPGELLELARTLADFPGRPMQFASDYGMIGGEARTLQELALLRDITAMDIPVFTPLQQYPVLGGWRRLVDDMQAMIADGARIHFEAGTRAIGALLGLEALVHPFSRHPSYMGIADRPLAERVAIMRTPEFRARLLAEEPNFGPADERIKRRLEALIRDADRTFVVAGKADYEPDPGTSVKAIADRQGRTFMDVFHEALTGGEGRQFLYLPLANFSNGNLDEQREILELSNTLFSFGDAGAHMAQICDAAYSSFALIHWGRDRANGLALERIVQQMTSAQADLFGFAGRGRIGVGAVADVNIIDHRNLALELPQMLYDLPGGGQRLMQNATGYLATLVGGIAVAEHDQLTGALPGTVLRSQSQG